MDGEGSPQTGMIQQLSDPLYRCKGWMKLVAVMSIIGGVLQALTIIGIVIAWLPIWTGILLFQSASAIRDAYERDSRDAMITSLSKLKTYFIIMGVLTLIGVILGAFAMLFGLVGSGLAIFSHRPH